MQEEIKKPENIEQYRDWFKSKLGVVITTKEENRYNSAVIRVKKDFEEGEFWLELNKNCQEYHDEYSGMYGYELFIDPKKMPVLYTKPFESLLLKTLRKNVLNNGNWPDPPEGGWIFPKDWFCAIKDTVRTTYIVKYIDGVEFFAKKIESLSDKFGVKCKTDFEAKEEGYYAAHLYLIIPFEIPKVDWDTELVEIPIEIQITTQLQDNIRKLLRKHYEERRRRISGKDEKWQWNYRSEEFATNYLGHILHYIEGMIIEIRERQRGGIK